MNDLPSWVPKYPGAVNTGVFSAKGTDNNGRGEGGSFTFTTSDPPRKVLDFYRDKAGELGLKVNMNTETGSGGMIVAAEEDEKAHADGDRQHQRRVDQCQHYVWRKAVNA